MNTRRVTATVIGEKARGAFLEKAAQGCDAGPKFLGNIHSCFERVFNIVLPEIPGYGTNVLVGLCRPEVPLSPLHLGIAWQSPMFDLPLREGEPVLVTRQELVFPSFTVAWGEAGEYTAFFRRREFPGPDAGPLSCSAARAIGDLCLRALAKGLTVGPHVREGLLPLIGLFDFDSGNRNALEPPAGAEYAFAPKGRRTAKGCELSQTALRAMPVICRLSAAVREQRQDGIFNAARDLLGLGPGLTPSGDDFLTGLILTDIVWRRQFPSGPVIGEQEMWLRLAGEASGLTGAVSCQQLRLAADSASNEVFERVCWRLLRADERVVSDIPALARFGATSGLDYLAGVVFALRHLLRACVPDPLWPPEAILYLG